VINTDINDKKIKIDIVKSKVEFSDIKVFIQNSNNLCASCFHHIIKTHILWGCYLS